MNTPRRVRPDSSSRRGWCPSLARPMPTGDGLLARIHPPLGILTHAQLRAVAEAARCFGNGHVDVTARANLQIRGVTEATGPCLVAALDAASLGDVRDDGGPQRLTLTSPRDGLDAEAIDVQALARAIEVLGLGIARLPAKTLVVIASGADLLGIEADLHVRATGSGVATIGLAENERVAWVAEYPEGKVPDVIAALLRAFAAMGRRRIRDLMPVERSTLIQIARDASANGTRAPLPPLHRGEGETPNLTDAAPTNVLTTEAPFGRCTAAMLDRLAEIACACGTGKIRLSPTRGFVLAGADSPSDALADLSAAGFITAPDDPRRAVAACPGAPACASGSTPTTVDAARLAEAFRPFAARGMTAHVSGCAKGCAHPGRADLTLVARDGRYGVVLDGTPGDAPAPELTFDAALERVWRAKSGTLAQAFASPSFGRRDRAEPAIGTTL